MCVCGSAALRAGLWSEEHLASVNCEPHLNMTSYEQTFKGLVERSLTD